MPPTLDLRASVTAIAVALACLGAPALAQPLERARAQVHFGGQPDALRNGRFRVSWDGRVIPGVTEVSPLGRTTEVVTHEEGGWSPTVQTSPGRTTFEPVTLERGLSRDTAFADWAAQTLQAAPANPRKNVRLEVLGDSGQPILAYNLYRCWVSEYQPLPELDQAASGPLTERITLECDEWTRDASVAAP
ncbi:MAG: phage tail protein [Caulobacterales bacterium]